MSLAYDPAGRLHQEAGGTTTRFLYDGADVIAEYNTSGTVLKRYVHGPGLDEPLVEYAGSGTTNRSYLLADERGSVIGVVNTAGTVTVNKYDEYGVPAATNQGRFQYTGQIWLSEVGLYHYKARLYDPLWGRFLQPDPIGTAGGMNLYGYVGNDPINFVDPSGLNTYTYCNDEDTCYPCPRFARCSFWPPGLSFPDPYTGTQPYPYPPPEHGGGGDTPNSTSPSPVAPPEECMEPRFSNFFADQFLPAFRIEIQYSVSIISLLSLSAWESGYGTGNKMYSTKNNPFGATPGGDATPGLSYESFDAAWRSWGNEWGPAVQNAGSNITIFLNNLASAGYNSQDDATGGDPNWAPGITSVHPFVERRLAQWLEGAPTCRQTAE